MGKTTKDENKDEFVDELIRNYYFGRSAVRYQIFLNFVNLGGIFAFYRKFQETRRLIREIVAGLVGDRLNCRNNSENSNSVNISQDSLMAMQKSGNIFIDNVIQLYKKGLFSWEDVMTESHTIIAASFETTTGTLNSTLIMLAMHPDVQHILYEELCNVFPEKDSEMSYEHMEQLPYLDRVINETLRLFPPIPILGRQVVKDTQLTADILLPKGLQILIPIYNLQRRTDIWGPQAAQFNPDNFLPGNMSGKHTHAFIPFSKGFRNCIGWRHAMFAMKTLLAGLVRNYRFTTSSKYEDIQLEQIISLVFVNEPGVEILRR